MNQEDHVALLRRGVLRPGGKWADLGAGQGAFTLALAELLGPAGTIYAVDQSGSDLRRLQKTMAGRFPAVRLAVIQGDFTRPLDLPPLDGLVMANSLHFVLEKEALLRRLTGYLKPGGRFLLVEYNTDRGNRWVPFPISYPRWSELAQHCGLHETTLLAARPSRFLGEIYAAGSTWPG
jgi:ubiquinone/menaquinone biosynthesis C-methylase UbiE